MLPELIKDNVKIYCLKMPLNKKPSEINLMAS